MVFPRAQRQQLMLAGLIRFKCYLVRPLLHDHLSLGIAPGSCTLNQRRTCARLNHECLLLKRGARRANYSSAKGSNAAGNERQEINDNHNRTNYSTNE